MRRSIVWLALVTASTLYATAAPLAQDSYRFGDPNVEDMFRYARMAAARTPRTSAVPTASRRTCSSMHRTNGRRS